MIVSCAVNKENIYFIYNYILNFAHPHTFNYYLTYTHILIFLFLWGLCWV